MSKKKINILIADDNEDIQEVIMLSLSDLLPKSTNKMKSLEDDLFEEDQQDIPIGDAKYRKDEVQVSKKKIFEDEYEIEILKSINGRDAVEIIKEMNKKGDPVHAIFMDILMPPGIDGVEALEQIWEIDDQLEAAIVSAHNHYSWEHIIDKFGCRPNLMMVNKPFEDLEIKQVGMSMIMRSIKRFGEKTK